MKDKKLNKEDIKSLEDFRRKYNEIYYQINDILIKKTDNFDSVAVDTWVSFDDSRPTDDCIPLIKFENSKFIYSLSERGKEIERVESCDPYEIMFIIFENITSEMASDFELKNRVEKQDHRRILFSKQLELISMIDEKWSEKQKKHFDKILEEHPFIDQL